MSWKTLLFIILILLLGIFMYFKYQAMGDPNSHFNQTTRFALARHSVIRTLLGLHNKGDAKAEYLENSGPLVIEWFKPETEEVDGSMLSRFADLVAKYTGRQTQVMFGGSVSEGAAPLSLVDNLALKGGQIVPSGSSLLFAVFATDYQPRDSAELSTTHGETTEVISLDANRQFLASNPQDLNNYLLSDLLHEFGNEIGLPEQGTDPSCIMNPHAGIDGQPLESVGRTEPQDFCGAEVNEINQLKIQF